MSDGLFQDDDIIRVVNREGILIAAGGAASLLQTAHPGVAQGVYDHSYTHKDPLGRLRNTMGWVYLVTWGDRDEAERLSALVRRLHTKVTGPGYEANDPELQAWVSATLFAVGAQFYQRLFRRRFSEAELAEFYEDSKIFATILGCPPDRLPATYPEFRRYYAEMLRTIQINDASRAIAHQVMHPDLPFYFRPGLAVIRLLTVGLMPAPIREQYGWTWNAATRLRFRILMTALSTIYPRLPRRLRSVPRDYYLRGTRRMLARTAEPRISVRTGA